METKKNKHTEVYEEDDCDKWRNFSWVINFDPPPGWAKIRKWLHDHHHDVTVTTRLRIHRRPTTPFPLKEVKILFAEVVKFHTWTQGKTRKSEDSNDRHSSFGKNTPLSLLHWGVTVILYLDPVLVFTERSSTSSDAGEICLFQFSRQIKSEQIKCLTYLAAIWLVDVIHNT